MAKEDFCFTYYDGDATRDMSHMNRLERGCYNDLIISIRKFGHLTIEQCKKILSKDFDDCWSAMELILKIDADGKYFIEWLENSLIKSKKHSEKQRENRIGKTKNNQNETKLKPNNNQNTILDEPLEDGNENGYEDEFKNKNEYENFLWTEVVQNLKNDFRWKEKFCREKSLAQPELEKWMDEFLADLELKEDFKDLKELKNHFTNWFNKKKITNGKTNGSFNSIGGKLSSTAIIKPDKTFNTIL